MTECVPQLRLPFHSRRHIDIAFDGPELSSDGGCLLLRVVDEQLQSLSSRVAALIPDSRDPSRVAHTRAEQVRQRLYQIAMGYQDCNDAHILRDDPAFKMSCDRLPSADGLSSQPTLCRFENAATPESNHALEDLMMDDFVASLPPNTGRLVLDKDGTMLETYGAQQLALFHGHYRCSGYLPLTVWDERGQLICVRLRAGTVPDSEDALALFTRLIGKLRARFPLIHVIVRGDGAFSMPELMNGLEALSRPTSRIDFVFGLRSNAVLNRATREQREAMASWVPGLRRFKSFEYSADGWPHKRRVIARMLSTETHEVDTRHVVTSLGWQNPRRVYLWYCRRGQAENWIKDFKLGTEAERMSCERFETNRQRLLLHGFAYMLLYRLRQVAGTFARPLRKVTPQTLRALLLKVACRIRQSARRLLVEFSKRFHHASVFRSILVELTGSGRS